MGKMGRVIIQETKKNDDFTVVAGVDKLATSAEGFDFPVYSDISKCTEEADVIIDFSRPEALPQLLRYGQKKHLPMVLCSTGYNSNDVSAIEFASENVAIMRSANMSVGINLLMELSKSATNILHSNFDIEIEERHHNQKVDAPSGTAVMLADAINQAAGGDLEYVYDRHERRSQRDKRELGMHALRGGTITGEHTVVFAGTDEVIELTHKAYSRNIFALGALRAAKFIVNIPCGLYNMGSLLTQQNIVTNAYSSESDAIISVSNIKRASLISDIFRKLKENEIMVDIISQTVPVNNIYNLSFSVSKPVSQKAYSIIGELITDEHMEMLEHIAKVTIEGSGMEHHAGVSGDIFDSLSKKNIPILLITTSETKITCCIPVEYKDQALEALKACFT
jgi:4-hydroxy-tetrahydrodipicolinate reductase